MHEPAHMPRPPWWKGARGEWYVVVQGLLFLLVLVGPRTLPSWPAWSPGWVVFGRYAGVVLILLGGAFALAAGLRLGKNLTPLPHPRDDSTLVVAGPYRIVRHPIYSGVLCAAFGWGFLVHGWLTLGYAVLVFFFVDVKSRKEECWLATKFPEYAAYQKRVRKLIPFVY